jgi:hypothetical protein
MGFQRQDLETRHRDVNTTAAGADNIATGTCRVFSMLVTSPTDAGGSQLDIDDAATFSAARIELKCPAGETRQFDFEPTGILFDALSSDTSSGTNTPDSVVITYMQE